MSQNKILEKSGWYILAILSLVPLALCFFSLSLSTRRLGDVAGLCGMAMFSLVMILSARIKFFEKFFKGINEIYTAHHFFGGLAFCLLLFHPLLLTYDYFLMSPRDAAMFLLPSTYWPQTFGLIGLLIMIITLVITFYTQIKYQIWKFTHKFLGLAFVFAFLHTFLIGSDVATNLPLKIYLFVLGTLGLVAYCYRTLFASFFVKTFEYIVKDIKENQDKIWEITFAPKNKEIKFYSGQFTFVKFLSNGLTKELHPFSFSSAAGNPLKIAVKELGDYTNRISSVKVGDLAFFEGPYGSFSFRNYSNKNQIWIAGGVGITPFLSMLRDLSQKDSDYKIDLYYSVREESGLAFKNEIENIALANKNLRVKFWVSKNEGFLNAEAIKNQTENSLNRDIFICGPGIMMSALKGQFLAQGMKKNQIHTEEFQLY